MWGCESTQWRINLVRHNQKKKRWRCEILFLPWPASILGREITHSHISINNKAWAAQNWWTCPSAELQQVTPYDLNKSSFGEVFNRVDKKDIHRTEKRKQAILVITSPLSAFTLCCVLLEYKSVHAFPSLTKEKVNHSQPQTCIYTYTVQNVWTTLLTPTCSDMFCLWFQNVHQNVNVYTNEGESHYHPTPHTLPIFGFILCIHARSNHHPLFPTFVLFSAVLVWQHWHSHTPTLFRS